MRPVRNDHYLRVCAEKERYGITLSDQEISEMSKNKFRNIVNNSVEKFAFSKLIESARGRSKFRKIIENFDVNNIRIQKYLISEDLVKKEKVLLFC